MLERRFTLAGRSLVPIVQGGMGVGISAHRLAGAVAREGGVGTIASIDLRHHHADLVAATEKSRDKDAINAANLVALDREIRAAREGSQGNGMIAVNVMMRWNRILRWCARRARAAPMRSSWARACRSICRR